MLHTILTATNDVLSGYDTMIERAEPEIIPIIENLQRMHRHHAAQQESWLARFDESRNGDESFRGVINQAVVTIRDRISGLDEGSLTAVRDGEQKLLDIYDTAMSEWTVDGDTDISDGWTKQFRQIEGKIEEMPMG